MNTNITLTIYKLTSLSVLYCIALCCTVLHCIVLYYVALYCIVLNCIVLHCIALHCIELCCIVLYRVALYCIVSKQMAKISHAIISFSTLQYCQRGFTFCSIYRQKETNKRRLNEDCGYKLNTEGRYALFYRND